MKTLSRMIREAKTSASECNRLMEKLREDRSPDNDDVHFLTIASNQALQAAREINQLIGYVSAKRDT